MDKNASPRFRLNKEDGMGILKTLIWTVATALVVAMISLNGSMEYPTEWLFLAPVVNTLLVTVYKALKDKGQLVSK